MHPTLPYQPQQSPHSEWHTFNGHAYHIRRWGKPDAPLLVMLHGWMDCADTFQFVADHLAVGWQIVAPDWRGFGHSAWNNGSYYSPDYLADLDALLQHYSPHRAANLVGHSMGAMVAGLYAGIRPDRVARLALVEGFGLAATRPAEAPGRYARWLREKQQAPAFTAVSSLDDVAAKLQARNPRMALPYAQHMAAALCHQQHGQWQYRADPRHKMVNPVLYRLEEAKACWQRISAPVLWVIGGDMWDHPMAKGVFDTLPERRACFAQLTETTIADAGHMIQWEQPAPLADTLAAFFAYA